MINSPGIFDRHWKTCLQSFKVFARSCDRKFTHRFNVNLKHQRIEFKSRPANIVCNFSPVALALNGGRLPLGAHGWWKADEAFWRAQLAALGFPG